MSLLFCAFLGVKQVDLASFVFVLFRLVTEKMRENDEDFLIFNEVEMVCRCVCLLLHFLFSFTLF